MSKKIVVLEVILAVMLIMNIAAFAATDVGNTICPVTNEKIDPKTKATYEYQGKIYNFCCPMCIDEFKKDPDKYIKKIKDKKTEEGKEK